MKARNELLDKGLRAIDPLLDDAGEDMSRLSAADEELLASILASGWDEEGRAQGPARRRALPPVAHRRLLVAVPVAAAGLFALIVGLPGGGGGGGTLPALARVAQAAAAQAPPATDLPYLYVKTREEFTGGTEANGQYWSVYQPAIREEWIAKDGSGRVRTIEARPRFVAAGDREAWEAAGRVDFLAHGWSSYTEEVNVAAGHFSANHDGIDLSKLPTDPAELAEWIERRVNSGERAGDGVPFAAKTLTLVAELLNEPLATPELRAALYEAEGRIAGIEYLGEATDLIGRRGVAIGAESAYSGALTLYSVIFDPKTSQVLAVEQTPREPAPASRDREAPAEGKLFIDSGSTGALGSRP
jgi:hypothetical protein